MKAISRNYWVKLLVLGLLIGSIPVILVGVFSYYRASGMIVKQANEANARLLIQTQLRIEQNLLGIDNTVTQFVNSPYLNNALHQDFTASDFVQIEELSSSLHRLQSFQFGMQDVHLANLQYGWVISNRGFRKMADWQDARLWASYLNGRDASLWLSYQDLSVSGAAVQDDGTASDSIFLLKNLPINAAKPTGFLLASVPGYEWRKYLGETDSEEHGSSAIFDVRFQPLTSIGEAASERAFVRVVEEKIRPLIQGGKLEGSVKAIVDGKNALVSYRRASYNDWTYVSVTPLRELLRDSNSIGLFTLLVCAGNLLLAFALSFLGSQRLYRPIRALYEAVTNESKVSTSTSTNGDTGDEIQQIGERLNRMRQSQTEMAEKIEGQSRYLREYFAAKLLQSPISKQEIKEKKMQYGLPDQWRLMSVMAVEIMTFEGTGYREEDRDLLMFAINNIAGELLSASERLDPVLVYPYQATVLGSPLEDQAVWKSAVVKLAEMLQSTVLRVLRLHTRIGISRAFGDWNDAYIAMGEAANALKAQNGFDEPAVLLIEDLQPNRNRVSALMHEQSGERLLDAILLRDRLKALKILNAIFAELNTENYGEEEIRFTLLRLMTVVIGGLQDQTESLQAIWNGDSTSLLEQFLKLRTLQDYRHWFENGLALPAIALLETGRDSRFKSISQKIKDMIHYDFAADLTLEVCASRLNYHPSYIRQVFRKETGMNFSDYLSLYRMEVAKKWLTQTDMKINEIAERLRYNNAQNFIRYFRKLEGTTPGQYREAHRQNERP
ncbi:AraC family transcriptional regulator [Cohnella hashimotonis]|uniref:AraC family transcriptional regulator n=1 Tax=Cohnella hashimotonis TaxID=2826895 RepID=A0ABT6TE87_9BACL|nr:AraC family transcriptional regulator [Cohnella hashimotonis]MDI4645148.1 AraC family transcriptional regulator [Cohnella hashimotonis]